MLGTTEAWGDKLSDFSMYAGHGALGWCTGLQLANSRTLAQRSRGTWGTALAEATRIPNHRYEAMRRWFTPPCSTLRTYTTAGQTRIRE